MQPIFRHDVRGILIKGGKVLTCKVVDGHSFYPGGGVELGERATEALLREFREELDVTVRITGFLGAYEWLWNEENGQPHHHITHFFEVDTAGLDPEADPTSQEPQIEFHWAAPEQLARWPVYPEAVHLAVAALIAGERRPWWFSETRHVDIF